MMTERERQQMKAISMERTKGVFHPYPQEKATCMRLARLGYLDGTYAAGYTLSAQGDEWLTSQREDLRAVVFWGDDAEGANVTLKRGSDVLKHFSSFYVRLYLMSKWTCISTDTRTRTSVYMRRGY